MTSVRRLLVLALTGTLSAVVAVAAGLGYRAGLQEARMMGLNTYFGNPLSEHADRFMDLAGYTELLAMSRNPEANAMVCAHFRHDFGSKHVYSIQPSTGDEDNQRKELAQNLRTNIAFSKDATWSKLASLFGQGAKIRSTRLTDEYDFESYNISQNKGMVFLFAINDKGRLKVFSSREELAPEAGWKVIALSQEDLLKKKPSTPAESGEEGQEPEDETTEE